MYNSLHAKRSKGQYFTKGNPFNLPHFKKWARQIRLSSKNILEPFAGANDIITNLQFLELCHKFESYDISPSHELVKKKDTIKQFPKDFSVCVTNPPWLARNSATRRLLPYPETKYDDLYKHCLSLCLENCDYVAAIIPASYLQSELFRERLQSYTLLHQTLFTDTENPACIALFNKLKSKKIKLYHDEKYLGVLNEFEEAKPKPISKKNKRVRFNDPDGKLGFISFDDTKEPTIRFCEIEEIQDYPIKVSSRFITRISGDFDNVPKLIKKLNKEITDFREKTKDVFLTPFKGIRKDGQYRRRMEFSLARNFINAL